MNLCQITENAVVTYLAAQALTSIPEGQIYHGFEGEETIQAASEETDPSIKCPCVIVDCSSMNHQFGLGNWRGLVRVEVHSTAEDTTRSEHKSRVDEVFSKLVFSKSELGGQTSEEKLSTELTAASDGFTAFQIVYHDQGKEVRGRKWVSFLVFEIEAGA